jgi:uncharacterized protein YjbI with pentapeptide repeats
MANQEHLYILNQGVEVWNRWRQGNPEIQPDLRKAPLRGANLNFAHFHSVDLSKAMLRKASLHGSTLSRANLCQANLRQANLSRAHLRGADLRGADFRSANLLHSNLSGANLSNASLFYTDLSGANLNGAVIIDANLSGANLTGTNLSYTDLSRADLSGAIFNKTNLSNANLTDCKIHGISVWNVQLEGTTQSNLVITSYEEPKVTVDNLEVAQFIYLLLNNQKIRDVIDTITSKVVLILGRFTPERKAVLDTLREELRKYDKLPVLFDFEKPTNRDFTETVRTLAHLAQFIIADISEPRSIPQELYAIIPHLAVPVQPLLYEAELEYGMFLDFGKYPWVLPVYRYKDLNSLLASLKETIIEPAEQKAKELEKR